MFLNLILFTIFTSTQSVKASTAELIFSPAEILVKEDSNFTVEVQIVNCPPSKLFEITVNYNTTVLDALNASVLPPLENFIVSIDENQGTIEISAITSTALEGNQTIAALTFKSTLHSNSTLLFSYSQIYDPQLNPIPHTTKTAHIEIVGSLNLIVMTSTPKLYLEQNITIYGNLTVSASPVNSLIGIEITSPASELVMTRIIGPAQLNESYFIQVLDFYLSDEQGNPKNTATAGFQSYFTITVQSMINEDLPLLIVINVFDRYNTPVGYTIFEGKIFAFSPVTFIGPVFVREEAFNGTAKAYADLFSDWPRNRGITYCPEKTTDFQIINGVTNPPPPIPSDSLSFESQYEVTFRLPLFTGMGNYTIHATSHYKVQKAYATSIFQAKLVCDFNEDGKVSPYDFAVLAIAYGSSEGEPRWNPNCDINKDNVIGPYDFAVLAINYGKQVKS